MSVTGCLTILSVSTTALLAACTSTSPSEDPAEPAVSQRPPNSSNAVVPTTEEPAPVAAPPRPKLRSLDHVKTTVIAPDISSLPLRGTTSIPWTDFLDNPENGRPQTLNSATHTMPITSSANVRESAVWATGIIWYADSGLQFMSWDGRQTKIKGGKGWYGEDAFAADKVYFLRRGGLMSVAEHDLTVRLEANVADLIGPNAGKAFRASMAGLLAGDDPVIRVSRRQNGSRVSHLYSLKRGYVPLPDQWIYTGATVAVGADPTRKTWAAYDTTTYRPLWSRAFTLDKKPVRLYMITEIPGGRYVALETGNQRHVYIVEARTGRVVRGLRFGAEYYDRAFEDPRHVLFPAHDGPPNPLEDPADIEPAPSEVTWPNVLVRCTLRGRCETVVRVDANTHAIQVGPTHLFSRAHVAR